MRADDPAQVDDLLRGRGARGNRIAVSIGMSRSQRRRETQPARRQRFGEQRRHCIDVARARRLVAARAHDVPPQRRMAHQEAGVGSNTPFEAIEILAKAPPVPGHPFAQALERHRLDPRQHPHHVVAALI